MDHQERPTRPARWQPPKATLNGVSLSLNRAAFALLGEPDVVVLDFDATSGQITITPACAETPGALTVRAPHRTTGRSHPNPMIYIGSFARKHQLATARRTYGVRRSGQGLVLTPIDAGEAA